MRFQKAMLIRFASSESKMNSIERVSPISEIPYVLIRAKKKTISIHVKPGQSVTVRAPNNASTRYIDACVDERAPWISEQQKRLSQKLMLPIISDKDKPLIKKEILSKAQYYLRDYTGKLPHKIYVRYGSSRWGSCSGLGNISLNGYLYFLPDSLFEYVLWHEVTHLYHLNHSPLFWRALSEKVPHPKSFRKILATYSIPENNRTDSIEA